MWQESYGEINENEYINIYNDRMITFPVELALTVHAFLIHHEARKEGYLEPRLNCGPQREEPVLSIGDQVGRIICNRVADTSSLYRKAQEEIEAHKKSAEGTAEIIKMLSKEKERLEKDMKSSNPIAFGVMEVPARKTELKR